MSKTTERPYQHGELYRTLIDAPLDATTNEGAANVRLRDVAAEPVCRTARRHTISSTSPDS